MLCFKMHFMYLFFKNKYEFILILIPKIDATTDGISFIMNALKLKFETNE